MSGAELVPGKLKREAGVHKETNIVYLVTFIFLVLTIIKVVHHEMFPDETEPWLIARDSNSISELLFNKRFESHPNLWYFLLYGVTRFSHNVHLMQALHVVIATGAAFIFLRYASFPLLTRILFCFGYFMFYEYSVISRIYALGLIFIFGACALYPQRYKYWLLFCVLLVLAAQSNLFAGMISGGIVLVVFYAYFYRKEEVPEAFSNSTFWIGVAILALGFSYSMFSMVKHPEHLETYKFVFHFWLLNQKLSYIFNAFFPVAPFEISFWGKNIFPASFKFKILVSSVVLVFIYFYLRQNKHLFYIYLLVLVAILAFFYFVYDGALRHQGHIFIFFVVLAWLNNYKNHKEEQPLKNTLMGKFDKKWSLNIILLIHVVGGGQASGYDLVYKFSAYKEVAGFLDKNFEKDSFIIGTHEFHSAPIAAYSTKFTRIYSYNSRRTMSYFITDQTSENLKYYKDSLHTVIEYCQTLSRELKKDIIVVSSKKNVADISYEKIKKSGAKEIFASTDVIYDFPLTVYKIDYKEQDRK